MLEYLAKFRRCEKGSTTIEFAVWIPIVVSLLLIVAETSHIFAVHAGMWEASRVGAREGAFHRRDASGIEGLARNILISPGRPYQIEAQVTSSSVIVEIRIPVSEAGLIGVFSGMVSGDIVARSFMSREPG